MRGWWGEGDVSLVYLNDFFGFLDYIYLKEDVIIVIRNLYVV